MTERPSSGRGRLSRLVAACGLAAALGVSYCSHRSEGHSDDSSEAGDTDTSPDSPEAGREPTSHTLLARLHNDTAAMSAETQEIQDVTRFLLKSSMNLPTQPDLSYKPFNKERGHSQEEPGSEESNSEEPGI